MNRHERRAADKRARYSLREFTRESAWGVGSIEVFDPWRLINLAVADPALLRSLRDWIDAVEQTRPLCLFCDESFSSAKLPTRWLLARANITSRGAILMGVCATCHDRLVTDTTLIAAAAAAMRAGPWPQLRLLDAANVHAGARA